MSEYFRCKCGWEGSEMDMDTALISWGSRETPPEYDNLCPSCERSWETMEEIQQELDFGANT